MNNNPPPFPQFALLPSELQSRVWHFFSAAATTNPRVLDFSIRVRRDSSTTHCVRWKAVPGPFLHDRVRAAATALTVCRECRRLTLSALPHTLAVQRGKRLGGLVHFDRARDVVAVSALEVRNHWDRCDFDPADGAFRVRHAGYIIPGFSDEVWNLALKGMRIENELGGVSRVEGFPVEEREVWLLLATFRNVRTVYELLSCHGFSPREMAWCGGGGGGMLVDQVFVHPYPRSRRLDQLTTVWPDVAAHHHNNNNNNNNWATEQQQQHNIFSPQPKQLWLQAANYHAEQAARRMNFFPDFLFWFAGVEAWPMVQFYGPTGGRILAELRDTPPEELRDGDGSDVVDAASCETEWDEGEWSRSIGGDDGHGDDGFVYSKSNDGSECPDDLPVDMRPVWRRQMPKTHYETGDGAESGEKDGVGVVFVPDGHVDKWLDGVPNVVDLPEEFFGERDFDRSEWEDGGKYKYHRPRHFSP